MFCLVFMEFSVVLWISVIVFEVVECYYGIEGSIFFGFSREGYFFLFWFYFRVRCVFFVFFFFRYVGSVF